VLALAAQVQAREQLNAVLDALASRGIFHLDLPMTPQRVWLALDQGSR
jgi:aerobic carbon-monoxide dehydrogenase large subunit